MKYDFIILGTPVWASNFTPPIRTFIVDNKDKLKNKKIAIFICYSGGGAEKVVSKLKEILEIENFEAELILIDPKDKKDDEKDIKIKEFCKRINSV